MTSRPASRRARATILAPRSWPSSPGLATRMRIFRSGELASAALAMRLPGKLSADLVRHRLDARAVAGDEGPVEPLAVAARTRDEVEVEVGHRLEGRLAVGLEQVEPVRGQRPPERLGDPLGGGDGCRE